MKALMAEIERVLPDGGPWCSLDKAQTLAAIVVGLRPLSVVEIGVWLGGSLVPMLLALRHNRTGHAIAIDPWSAAASVAGESSRNVEWWGRVDHEAAYRTFRERLTRHELASYCSVVRASSDEARYIGPPAPLNMIAIDLLHIDGNHSDQAVRDVEHFAVNVRIGGVLVLDDVGWEGGNVSRARDLAQRYGFVELYPLGTGVVMQRTSADVRAIA